MRSVYYLAGLLVSGYYLHYLSGHGSTNLNQLSLLRWNHFVPLAFCLFGLLHSVVVGRSRPNTDGYVPQADSEAMVTKDDAVQ